MPARSLLMLSCLLLGATTARSVEHRPLSGVVRVPMDHSTGHVSVDVFVQGEGPFRFQLDTGAGLEACLDESFARRFSLPKVGSTINDDGTGQGAVRRDLVRVSQLRLGEAVFEEVTALVADYSWIGEPGERPVAGLIGFQLFAGLLLSIDYQADEIRIERGELREKDRHVIPFDASGGAPVVSLQVGGRKARAWIDTGDQGGLTLPDAWVDRLRLGRRVRVVGRARTVNNEIEIRGARLRKPVELAGHELHGIDARFMAFRRPILGHGVLGDFVLTFDLERELVRFGR